MTGSATNEAGVADSWLGSLKERALRARQYLEFRDRLAIIRTGIEPGTSLALEIGPLDRPALTKPKFDVRYLDFADTETLRAKYADDPDVARIVDIDYVWDGSTPLTDVVGDTRFDAIVAAHVIEHIPDPIGWLEKFAQVLRPGGFVNLVVPDKRVTFDVNRRLTEVADLVDAYLRKASRPSYAQLFDFHTRAVMPTDTLAMWDGTVNYSRTVRPGDLAAEALGGCRAMRDSDAYNDVHCSVFTPSSFIDICEVLGQLELIDFAVADLVATPPNTIEFYVRLERLDPEAPLPVREMKRRSGIERAREAIAAAPAPLEPVPLTGPDLTGSRFVASSRERRLIEGKRRAMSLARRISQRLIGW